MEVFDQIKEIADKDGIQVSCTIVDDSNPSYSFNADLSGTSSHFIIPAKSLEHPKKFIEIVKKEFESLKQRLDEQTPKVSK